MSDFILDFWESQAVKHGASHSASWGDNFAISLEIENIQNYIVEGDNVLDVGCANGYSMRHQLAKKPRSLTGIDFSASMIEQAKSGTPDKDVECDISFHVGDVRDLPFDDEKFDVVYTTRTLINLPTWKEQIQGITECMRVCRSGGKVIISEAFWEPLVLLNSIRTLKSLAPLVEHDFNRYLKKTVLEDFLIGNNIRFEVIDFSSIYYLGSRFLRELVTDANAYPGYSNPINEIFYKIEKEYSGGGFGIQQAYIVTKNSD